MEEKRKDFTGLEDEEFEFLNKEEIEYEDLDYLLSILDEKGIDVKITEERHYFLLTVEGRSRYFKTKLDISAFIFGILLGMRILTEKIVNYTDI